MKVLLVDTGFSAMPIYNHLVAQGHDVWVMGNRPNDPIARKAGKRWIAQDYSSVAEVGKHANRLGIEKLVPGCTDLSLQTCVALQGGSQFLDSSETNHILADKLAFRLLCERLDLPSPRPVSPEQLPSCGRLICKPTDAFSGRGITVFEANDAAGAQQAMRAAKAASPSQRFIVETFVTGQLHSYSAFIENGRVCDSFFVREGSSINPFAVDTSFVCHDMPPECHMALRSAVEKIAAELKLVDGLVHTQFLWDGESVAIVEIARRCPGDLYALLIEYATGYGYAGKYASYLIGQPFETHAVLSKSIVRHTVTSSEGKNFEGLSFAPVLPVKAFFSLCALGETLLPGHRGRIGILFCDAEDEDTRDATCGSFLGRSAYSVL